MIIKRIEMRKRLFIVIGLLSWTICKGQNQTDFQNSERISVPLGFECFNQPHIYIKYKQPINGYTVKVMWLQDSEVGNALFCLEKQGIQYYYFAEKWTDKILYDKGNTYPNNTVIELDYTAKLESEEYLSDDSPFFFSDIDFDGEDEFVINRYKSGSRDSNAYDVYDVSPYGYFIQKTEAPFTELENGQCEFDSKNKTITVFGSNGWNNEYNVVICGFPAMDSMFICVFRIEYILSSEPRFINQVVLCVAYPRRSEDFRHVTGTCCLGIPAFKHTGHDDMTVVPGNQMWKNRICILVPFAKTFIIRCGPKDIALNTLPAHRMVFEQGVQQIGRKPKDTILQYVNFNGHFLYD